MTTKEELLQTSMQEHHKKHVRGKKLIRMKMSHDNPNDVPGLYIIEELHHGPILIHDEPQWYLTLRRVEIYDGVIVGTNNIVTPVSVAFMVRTFGTEWQWTNIAEAGGGESKRGSCPPGRRSLRW